MTVLTPRTQSSIGWQYLGQPQSDWPIWVRRCCFTVCGDLIHERRSGRQVVYRGEWLVRDLDGGIVFYTDDEIAQRFARS